MVPSSDGGNLTYYTLRSRWENPLHHQVFVNINVQLLVPLLVLGNFLGKTQWQWHPLIQFKYHVIRFRWSTYLSSMMIQAVCTHVTHHTSLTWLVQPAPVSRLSKLNFTLMDFPLILTIVVLLPCLILSRTFWVSFKTHNTLSTVLGSKGAHDFLGHHWLNH